MGMTISEYDEGVRRKLDELAGMERNRGKYQKIEELDALRENIKIKGREIREAVGKGDYGLAITLKTELAHLETGRVMLEAAVREAMAAPDYDLGELKEMCIDTMAFYECRKMMLLKQRLSILGELERNMEAMEETVRQFRATEGRIERNMPDYNPFFSNHACFSIPTGDSGLMNKKETWKSISGSWKQYGKKTKGVEPWQVFWGTLEKYNKRPEGKEGKRAWTILRKRYWGK